MGNGHSTISPGNRAAARALGLNRFPHMGPLDVAVWVEFLNRAGTGGSIARYDVLVGEGRRRGPDAEDDDEVAYRNLLRKRVDVVLSKPGHDLVCEVKPIGGMSALGQALVYRDLIRTQEGAAERISAAVVCGVADLDCVPTYQQHGVGLWDAEAGQWLVVPR
jgi:hypothetical protein